METTTTITRVNPRRRSMVGNNRFAACHMDNLGNLHIVNQLKPVRQRAIRPYSEASANHYRTHPRVRTARASLENYSNASISSSNKPLPSFFERDNDIDEIVRPRSGDFALERRPAPPPKDERRPTPPPKDHFAQVLECKHVSIQRMKTPRPRRLLSHCIEDDVVALVKVYRPPRRVRIHWLRVLKEQKKLAFPIILILMPTRKNSKRASKVLVVGRSRRPETYVEPQTASARRQRYKLGDDMKYGRKCYSTSALEDHPMLSPFPAGEAKLWRNPKHDQMLRPFPAGEATLVV